VYVCCSFSTGVMSCSHHVLGWSFALGRRCYRDGQSRQQLWFVTIIAAWQLS
jgi:hypothetical protein